VRLRGAILLVGLLTGTTIPLAVPASVADPVVPRGSTTVSARLYPPVVTAGEPAVLAGSVTPATADLPVVVERRAGETWVSYAETTTNGKGAFQVPLDTTAPASTRLRVTAGGATSHTVTFTVGANTSCSPATPSVDPDRTGEATCLLTRLDRWRRAGLMGVGQQLNVSALAEKAFEPLVGLDDPVAVIGFDLEELDKTAHYEYPFVDEQIDHLLTLADQGAVLTASWHATNPATGKPYTDRSWHRLADLLDDSTPAAQAFWADYDEKLDLLARFQDGDGGRHRRTAVVFRPLHEANGGFFWWGKPDPKVYRKVWARMQQRAWDAGVHNIVWAYSGNRWTSGVRDPGTLVPAAVDLGGLDTYDPEKGADNARDHLWLEGYSSVRAKVSRMALTEVGPHGSKDGSWRPAVVTRTVRARDLSPAWAMFWFDDGTGSDGVTGRKQISSLDGGPAWLASCPNGLCPTS